MIVSGRFSLQGTLHEASAGVEALRADLADHAPVPDCEAVELGVAEIVSNIIRHGYAGQPGPIRIAWLLSPTRIVVRVCDCGAPIPRDKLDAAQHASIDFSETGIDDLPEGGIGLAFVRQMFHTLDYRSRGRLNRLVASRRLDP